MAGLDASGDLMYSILWGFGLALWLSSIIAAFSYGSDRERDKWEERHREQQAAILRLTELRTELRDKANADAAERQREFDKRVADLRVSLRKTTENLAGCRVSLDALRLLDSAATGVPPVPDAAGKPDEGPSPADSSCAETIQTCGENYAACRANAADQEALIQWIRENSQLR